MSDAAGALEHAFAGLVDAVAGVAPGWLVLGVVLHLANQVARGRGWYAVVRTACDGRAAARRDAVAAWVAGAGAGGVVSARGGDAVRVLVLAPPLARHGLRAADRHARRRGGGGVRARRRAAGARRWRSASGRSSARRRRARSTSAPRVLALAGVRAARPPLLARARLPHAGRAGLRGAAAARRATRATCCRGSSPAACCGSARWPASWPRSACPRRPPPCCSSCSRRAAGASCPFSPASVGAGAAILAATFEPVTGTAVPAAQVAAFFVGTSTVLTVVGTVLALAICAQASAKVGPSFGARRPLDADPRRPPCRGRSPRCWRRRRRSCRTRSGCRWRPPPGR